MLSEIMSLHNNCESESFMSYNKIATRVTLVRYELLKLFINSIHILIYKLMNYTDLLNCNMWNATKQFLCHSLSFWFHNICIISLCLDNVNYKIRIVFNFILIQIQKLWHKDMIISLCIFCCIKIKYLHILIYWYFRVFALDSDFIYSWYCLSGHGVLGTTLMHEPQYTIPFTMTLISIWLWNKRNLWPTLFLCSRTLVIFYFFTTYLYALNVHAPIKMKLNV